MIIGKSHSDKFNLGPAINNRPNTIRFIIGSLDVGGAETHLSRILPELKDDTFQPVVITLTHKGELADALEKAGIPVLEPSSLVRFIQRIPILSRLLGPVVTICYLVRVFIKTPARLTCFYLPSSYYLGMIAAMITADTRNTLMFRRSLNDYYKKRPIIRFIEHQLHKITRSIVGNSEAVIRQLANEEGVPADKLTLIYNGIDVSKFSESDERVAIRERLGIGEDVIVLSIVANLIPYKGHSDLIEALAMIAGSINQPWLLLSVGTGIDSRPDLQKLVKSKNLSRHVRWLGQRRDVAEILSASDIGLLVSYHEGFSNSLLEGMAAGLPMIVTDVGGNPEAIIHQQCGLVVPPGQPPALAEAILALINDRETARQYGAVARARVEEKFSIRACVENYKQLFSRIIPE